MTDHTLLEAPGISFARAEGVTPPKQLDGIQILRGVAASMVVFHHYCLMINQYSGHSRLAAYRNFSLVGAAGVDVFFVISGFIIVYTLLVRERSMNWTQFALARIKRVVPLYWIFTLLIVMMWATHKVLKSMILTPDLLIRSLFFLPLIKYTVGAVPSTHPILAQGWTLQYEMFFYLICTVTIAVSSAKKLFPYASIGVCACLIAALAIPGLPTFMSDPILLEFVAGAGLGWLAGTGRLASIRNARLMAWLAIAAGTAGLLLTSFLPAPFDIRVLAWGVPSVLLVFGGILVTPDRSSRISRAAIYIGSASYSIYLGHGLLTLIAGNLMKTGRLAWAGDGFLFLATSATIFLASLVYPLIERPIGVRLSKTTRGRTGSALQQGRR